MKDTRGHTLVWSECAFECVREGMAFGLRWIAGYARWSAFGSQRHLLAEVRCAGVIHPAYSKGCAAEVGDPPFETADGGSHSVFGALVCSSWWLCAAPGCVRERAFENARSRLERHAAFGDKSEVRAIM